MKKIIIGYILTIITVVQFNEFLYSKGYLTKASGNYSWGMILFITLSTILIVSMVFKHKRK
jgi:hypothetical protein